MRQSSGNLDDVYYAVRNSAGGMVRGLTQLTADFAGSSDAHYYPNAASLPGGRVLLSWTRGGSYGDIYYAVLDSNGNSVKGMTALTNDGSSSSDWRSDAAALSDGRTVVAWTGSNYPAYQTRFAVLDGSYNRISGPTTLANPAAKAGEGYASVASAGTNAVITWMDYDSSYRHNLYYALVASSGAVRTAAQIFRTSQATVPYIETSFSGFGNASNTLFTISGRVTDGSNQPIAGVTLSAGGGRSTTTDSNGNYSLANLPTGTYTVTPSKAGYTFSPSSRTVTVPPDASGQNFVGVPPPRLRLLYVPLRWGDSQASFNAEAQTQSGIFINDVPLRNCRDRVVVETLDVTSQNFSTFSCSSSDCGVSSVRTFVRDNLSVNLADYDVIVGLAATSPCAPIAGCSNGTDTIWVTAAHDSVTAHELGHIYGLEDEYCSNQAGSTDSRCNDGDSQGDGAATGDVNWLDAALPCDCPPNGSSDSGGSACCNFGGRSCATVDYGVCCLGNKNAAGGRSTMSYADAPGPRGFDSHDLAHLNALPELNCSTAAQGATSAQGWLLGDIPEPILDVNLRVYQDDRADEVNISLTQGRPTRSSVLQGMNGDYRLTIVNATGSALWSQAFNLHFDYTGPVVLDTDYSGINYDEVAIGFRIPYQCEMKGLALYHGGVLIFSKSLPYKCLFLPLILRDY